MRTVEYSAKTIEEAINVGLKEVGLPMDEVKIDIIKHPGIFSKGIISITYNDGNDNLEKTTPKLLLNKIEKRAVKGGEEKPSKPKFGQDQKKPQFAEKKQEVKKVIEKPKELPKKELPNAREHKPFNFTDAELAAAKEKAEGYLTNALKLMNVAFDLKSSIANSEVNIEIVTDASNIVGYRGETLDSLEYLATLSLGSENKIRLNLDCGGYREKRTASLVELAKKLADKAVRTGKKVNLEPMNSANRKVIHSVLSERADVFTKSEGQDPNRYLVIVPKKSGNGENRKPNGDNNRNRNRNRRNGNRGDRQPSNGTASTEE